MTRRYKQAVALTWVALVATILLLGVVASKADAHSLPRYWTQERAEFMLELRPAVEEVACEPKGKGVLGHYRHFTCDLYGFHEEAPCEGVDYLGTAKLHVLGRRGYVLSYWPDYSCRFYDLYIGGN